MTRRLVFAALAIGLGTLLAGCSNIPTPTVTTVTVTGAAPRVGATAQFTADATFSDGSNQDVTSAVDPAITWLSSNPAVATVSTTGVVTGVAAGSAVITATWQTVSGTMTIQIAG